MEIAENSLIAEGVPHTGSPRISSLLYAKELFCACPVLFQIVIYCSKVGRDRLSELLNPNGSSVKLNGSTTASLQLSLRLGRN